MIDPDRVDEPLSRRRTALLAFIACVLGLTFVLVALEGVMRFLPVREGLETQPVNRDAPYLHFKPNNDVLFSMGWNFEIVNRVHVNNFGFVNDQDYDASLATPLLAVVGDSFVEAAQVPYAQSVHGRLARAVGGKGRVYSFGTSGSALSQYLAYARLARDRFRPRGLAVVVIGNDFDESLLEYKSDPGFHYLARRPDGRFELELVPYAPSLFHSALRRSALARYVHGNGFVGAAARRIASLAGGGEEYVANTVAQADAGKLEASRDAVDYFLAELPASSGVSPDRIVLVVDGLRPQLYDAQALERVKSSYFMQMRSYLMDEARRKGYRVADLEPRFIQRHARDGVRFEWVVDSHWNAYGHEEAAAAILESGVPTAVFGTLPAR